jgi:hypothetical protein
MMLGLLLPSIQPQPFLEWTRTSFKQCLAEFYTLILEEHIQVALEMSKVGNVFLIQVSKTDQSASVIFKSGDCVEVHLRALQTVTEDFQMCEWGHCRLGKLHRFFGNNVWIMGCI